LLPRVTDARRIVAFRNRLIHGYASVSNEVVWGVVEGNLPVLQREIRFRPCSKSPDQPIRLRKASASLDVLRKLGILRFGAKKDLVTREGLGRVKPQSR
jgi:hypothetical protein